jgi:hypothetical protein
LGQRMSDTKKIYYTVAIFESGLMI